VDYNRAYIFYIIVVNIAAFYLVAFLSSYPSEQARKSRVELRAKQDDIIKLEALNEWIIRSITSGLITLDDQGRIILFNPASERIFGIDARLAIGSPVTDILPELKPYCVIPAVSDHQQKVSQTFIDLPYKRSDEREVFLRFSISPLILPEMGQKGQILAFQDMTDMRKIEEDMKRVEGLAMIGELAAGIAHEIRNPMASISGSIQMLKEGLDQDDVNSRLMGIILREINRLNHLVNDFLLFARPKRANFRNFDLHQLIIEALELFKKSGKWTEKLAATTHFDSPIQMESDPEQIKQVLWNLFLNAIEAMPDGGSLHITTHLLDDQNVHTNNGKMVEVKIRDTGEGFSDNTLSHLFTPFFTTKDEGSGLGLAIVKRIIEGLDGSVHGANHSDGGAEITILLHPSPMPSA